MYTYTYTYVYNYVYMYLYIYIWRKTHIHHKVESERSSQGHAMHARVHRVVRREPVSRHVEAGSRDSHE